MSDRRRIVTLDAAGVATTVKDVEDGVNFVAVRGSFQVQPGAAKPLLADTPRRFAGSREVGETHENGEISWKMLVAGTTADLCLQNAEAALGSMLAARTDLWFEWRADGATNSTFYEIRGTAKFKATYDWAQFAGALSMYVDVAIPVAPLPRGTPSTIAIAATDMPAVVALGSAIGGDAPALADIALTASGGTSPPIWALIGWTKRPGSPLATSVAPFGIIEAETGGDLVGWADGTNVIYRGSHALITPAISSAGGASATYAVDPSVMQPDDFARGEVDIEVWARISMDATLVSPRAVLSLQPFAGLSFGTEQFSAEYGSSGKPLVRPSTGFAARLVRLGVLTMPVDVATPLKWKVKVALNWAGGASSTAAMDYLVMVPARQRVLSRSGRANDSSFPKFIASTGATTKTIRSDLSGRVASGAGNSGRDHGLGGSPLELPPGNVDLVVLLSSVVPDDPTSDTSSNQLAHTGVTGVVTVTPRYWLARGS